MPMPSGNTIPGKGVHGLQQCIEMKKEWQPQQSSSQTSSLYAYLKIFINNSCFHWQGNTDATTCTTHNRDRKEKDRNRVTDQCTG
ncbi:hypothetical protein UPYG_G00040330 [Umbra pygmaea]|uniref:Uncharacterized protein n=1 Tax=Umbra pygmaea TaxID=75934 RepID=A0ABD0XRK8_UMBPY